MNKCIYNPAYRSMVNSLRKSRLNRSLRQSDVARVMGTSRNWVSKIERCEVRLDILQFAALCTALDLDPAELIRMITNQ